ncbi:MAG TPA: twin-arginine translocation signal domain-containing protein [Candidatus Krumholzibacteria bacterium]|nr:twin-arginine translocation signal domain-containing protein [Candidatus Krumholzibacteria bacterium]
MSTHRRDFLKTLALGGAAVGLGALGVPRARADFAPMKARKKLRILVLGGTRFLGLHAVKIAMARGHEVTLFNRGRSNPGLFPDLVQLRGDRNDDLKALETGTWDAVIDTSGYVPRVVSMSCDLLRDRVEHYLFVSTISVYADFDEIGLHEGSAVGKLEDESIEQITGETYGPLKALCEQAAERSMPGRVWNLRPGLIVGPNDRSDRFTYWPLRLQRGGRVLAPEGPAEPVQIIDVRDLAEFMIDGLERRVTGVMNAVSPPDQMSMGEMLDTCRAVAGTEAEFAWVPTEFLAEHEVQAWSDMPCWIPKSEEAGAGTIQVRRALDAGLVYRPLSETVRDTLDWWATEPAERREAPLRSGLTEAREAEVLAEWDESRGMKHDALGTRMD